MSFSFGFGGDDIEQDETEKNETVPAAAGKKAQPFVEPVTYTLTDLLSDLPSQISYNTIDIASNPPISVHRRSLFDIRTQLMAESSTTNNNDELIANIASGDLTSGSYEGGFKTWECAIDLANYLAQPAFMEGFTKFSNRSRHVIELGAGSAIPSLTVLRQLLALPEPFKEPIAFTLADYNRDVLKLCTGPNVFLTQHLGSRADGYEADQELDLEEIQPQIARAEQDLATGNLSINFISGAWGEILADRITPEVNRHTDLVVLASETIYSPDTLTDFIEMLAWLLRRARRWSYALIAAKQIYFGVGGGVAEFEQQAAKHNLVVRKIWQSEGGTVGRVILRVRPKHHWSDFPAGLRVDEIEDAEMAA